MPALIRVAAEAAAVLFGDWPDAGSLIACAAGDLVATVDLAAFAVALGADEAALEVGLTDLTAADVTTSDFTVPDLAPDFATAA